MNRRELDGLCGMFEMEEAVELMLQRSEATGVPFGWLTLHPEDFIKQEPNSSWYSSLVGFCQLLARGWVVPGYPNSEFKVDKSLTSLMRGHNAVWRDLPDPPTLDEWFNKRFPSFEKKEVKSCPH